MTKVFFIGAGPGDPDLITVKGKKILDSADVIIYAGSLVNKEILNSRKPDSLVYDSATMNLEEIIGIIKKNVLEGKIVARVHTGDPSIYGAIKEQMDLLEEDGIEYEVIPGVSSFVAAAAVLKKEFTLPNVSQTVICTRISGRTEVPEKEDLEKLSSHRTSMAIFLSVSMIEDVVKKLLKNYAITTPVAVVYKATWKDQKILEGTLGNIVDIVKKDGIKKTAIILIGDFLSSDYEKSKLYDKSFSHEYRGAT
ncbi:MAG: precorrin-4 C(11)-methyltransferase [Methanofastidiosum sp.]|nr:precorrin-4 C(11)-methyltransferase [Bacteroidales bacterium]